MRSSAMPLRTGRPDTPPAAPTPMPGSCSKRVAVSEVTRGLVVGASLLSAVTVTVGSVGTSWAWDAEAARAPRLAQMAIEME